MTASLRSTLRLQQNNNRCLYVCDDVSGRSQEKTKNSALAPDDVRGGVENTVDHVI